MYLVEEEVVVGFPLTIGIELTARYLMQVNERHSLFGSHLHQPLCVLFSDNPPLFIVCIARCQRHQYGMTALRANIIDVFAHIAAISVDRLLFASLLDGDIQCVIAHAGNAGPCTS